MERQASARLRVRFDDMVDQLAAMNVADHRDLQRFCFRMLDALVELSHELDRVEAEVREDRPPAVGG